MSDNRKLAVIFPGIGYHKDKPLLYYAGKLLRNAGYELLPVGYHDMPQKIRGDREMMRQAALLAYEQSCEQLEGTDLSAYNDLVFVGKSIGTVALEKYAADHELRVRRIWYTPVEATLSYWTGDVIAFIGDADPWSDVDTVKHLAAERGIRLFSYPDCDHSLECGDVDRNLVILREVMRITAEFIG